MKRILSFIIPLITVGCTQSYEDVDTISTSEEFYATIEVSSADTRTYVDENITTRWHADDRLTIFKKETYNREYKFKGKTGENSGGFTQVSVDDDFYSSETLDKNYAIYPHSNDNRFIKQTESFEITMPAEQTYAENTFGRGANTMVAVSETGQLLFKNVGSFLRVRLWGEDTAVSSITITSNGDEVIAGEATVKPTLGGDPTCVMTGSTKSITLNCPTPVTISKSESTPTDFWIVLPPVTFENGFTVTVKDSNDSEQTYDVDKSFTFARNTYYNLKREVTICEETTQPTEIPNNQIWYTSTDGQIVTPNKTESFGANIVSNVYKNGKGVITFDGKITSIGYSAFYDCDAITGVTLPNSITSIERAAFNMCTSLTNINIPEGVTTIGYYAFSGCTSLANITIPNSVATIETKAFYCCESLSSVTIPNGVISIEMGAFSGCDNLSAFYGKYASADNRYIIIDGELISFAPAGLTEYTIPNDVITIGAKSFMGCSLLKSITLGKNTTTLKHSAFAACSSLSTMTIPANATLEICDDRDYWDLFNSTPIETITISDGASISGYIYWPSYNNTLKCVVIGNGASVNTRFYCDSLTTIIIEGDATISDRAFYRDCTGIVYGGLEYPGQSYNCDCTDLIIYCKSAIPPTLGNNVFNFSHEYVPGDGWDDLFPSPFNTIRVPSESVSAYKSANGWKDYAEYIEGYNF